jgi:hypothetical protein
MSAASIPALLAEFLTGGAPQTAGPLVLLPLILAEEGANERGGAGLRAPGSVTTLTTALQRGDAKVVELDGGGHVPTLKVRNGGSQPLLLLDGEELVGAKQNRVLNTSVLVPAHTELEVPVSCVERGRWRHVSPNFASRSRSMPARMKRDKTMRVSASLAAGGRYDADQRQVWADVDTYAEARKVRSSTSALGDVFEADGKALRDAGARFHVEPGQIGVAAWLSGRLLGVELLFGPAVFAEAFDRIVHSYVSEALGSPSGPAGDPPVVAAVQRFLRAMGDAPPVSNPSPGVGTDVRLTSPAGVAAMLLDEDERLVHLSAWPAAA